MKTKSASLTLSLICVTLLTFVNAHTNTGLHQLQGFDPPPEPVLPEITGAFEVEVTFRFDRWNDGVGDQTVFEFGNGPSTTNSVYLWQKKKNSHLTFGFHCPGGSEDFIDTNSGTIQNGVVTTWTVGIEPSGRIYIIIDGSTEISKTNICIPPNVTRAFKVLGDGMTKNPLIGAVLGIRVSDSKGISSIRDLEFQNIPGQILLKRDFTASMYVRFGDLSPCAQGGQHVFDFTVSGVPGDEQIYFAQVGTSTDLHFGIRQDGITYMVELNNAIVLDEMAFWHVGLQNGYMWIQKNSNVVANVTKGIFMSKTFRQSMLIGESSDSMNCPFDGVILSVRVD